MTIINQRWPRDIAPESCRFGRSRNDVIQLSPRTRQEHVIAQGRPLWSADCSWALPNTEKLAKLRYWLEALEGFRGSAQLWDFASPYPYGLELVTTGSEPSRIFWTYLGNRAPWNWGGLPSHWQLDATISVAANAAIGATSVQFSGLAASTIAAVQGQYIQIGRRLYLVAATAMTDGTGAVTIALAQPLLAAVTIGDPARLIEAACEMRLASQDWDSSARAGDGLIVVSAKFIETVQDFA